MILPPPPPNSRLLRRASRRGLTVLEATMALFILVSAVAGLLQILTVAASHRRATEIRRLALQEAANQAEQIALLPWSELAADNLASRRPSADLLEAAPAARLAVTATEETDPPAAKRISISVTWTTPAGDFAAPVQLTVWRYQP